MRHLLGLQPKPAPTPVLSLRSLTAGVAAACLIFQVGHFYEHVAQWAIWLIGSASGICGRDTPWMSPWVTYVVEQFGAWAWPSVPYKVEMARSMEVLHIVGNLIFLTGLAALMVLMPNRWVKWAFGIELFHLYEHIMLTTTVFTVGKPIGMSTLFGGAFYFDPETTVGIRVTWHALMNLIPMPFAMMGMMQAWKERAE
jgi:hypothetical protein